MGLDFRMDDGAMSDVMHRRTAEEIGNAILDYVTAQYIHRGDEDKRSEIREARSKIWDQAQEGINRITYRFQEAQEAYKEIQKYEYTNLQELGTVGTNALRVHLQVDEENRDTYKTLVAESFTWARSHLMVELFDAIRTLGYRVEHCEMISRGDSTEEVCSDLLDHEEQLAAYLFLRLMHPDMSEVRLDIDMDLDPDFFHPVTDRYHAAGYKNVNKYIRGKDVAKVQGGLFDLEALPHPLEVIE
jgi:hypothetical protein